MSGPRSGRSHGASAATTDSLYGGVASPVARLDAAVELVCLLGFVLAVVATPPAAFAAFAAYAVMLLATAAAARVPAMVMLRRLSVEAPFVLFAVALPFIGSDPRTEVLGVPVSIAGSWAAWSILVKATLGVGASVVLAWSTPVADLLGGLERLRCPKVLVAIAGFMVRYLDVVSGELHRLQVARISRGDDPRWFWQGRAVAATAGTMFVRSFERGERIQRSMLARGFTGTFPSTVRPRSGAGWFPAVLVPLAAIAIAVTAQLVTP